MGHRLRKKSQRLNCKDTRWLSVRAALRSPAHLLKSIFAKSEFDMGFPSAAAFVAVPFSTLPAGALCRCSERGTIESWVRPLPLDPNTWRGIMSPEGRLEPALSAAPMFLRGGLLMATEILFPSTSMPSIFSTA